MSRPLAHLLNAFVAALVLVVISPAFAQTKPPSMVGQKRDQIVSQLGDPKSSIKAGSREVMFFDHVKITLRNGVAIETEAIVDEPPPVVKRPVEAAAATPASASNGPSAAAAPSNLPPPPLPQPAANAPAPSALSPAATAEPAGTARTTPAAPDAAPVPVKPPEPQLAIKFIKPASGAKPAPRPAANATVPPAAPVVEAKSPPPDNKANIAEPKTPAPKPVETKAPEPAVAATSSASETEKVAVGSAPETPSAEESTPKPAADLKRKAAIRRRWWRMRRDVETEDDDVPIFSLQSYVVAALAIAAGAGFLWWQRRQRELELAATALSHTPFEPAAGPADTTGLFSAELIGALGQKKFERLVASYYAKTGVVAERTHAGPESPVHIKIFWKGEPKPFAGVQCHANPPTLIGPLPLVKLFEALSSADIRRGYIVTTGKFNVEARDLAEEKHFTLLPGDLFLEKLNALPVAARSELLKETNSDEGASLAPGPTIG